jgi:hypothetical protein
LASFWALVSFVVVVVLMLAVFSWLPVGNVIAGVAIRGATAGFTSGSRIPGVVNVWSSPSAVPAGLLATSR